VTCIDKRVPGRPPLDTAAINRVNRKPRAELGANELASEWNKRWADGQQLRVGFLDGVPEVHARVIAYAQRWQPYINLDLAFGNFPDADIRISFQQPGYWSYVGTDATCIAPDQPTMNFEGWTVDSLRDDREIKRTVLHEFGHALGCVHEHQSPRAGIPWDVARVNAYYLLTQGWSAQETYTQVLRKYDVTEVRATDWDPRSIMQYPVDKSLTLDGFEIPWNDDLSPNDIEFIQLMYPRGGTVTGAER
jgi:hypothetical protein